MGRQQMTTGSMPSVLNLLLFFPIAIWMQVYKLRFGEVEIYKLKV